MKKTAVSKSDLELLSAATDEDLMAHTEEGKRLRKSAATLVLENAEMTVIKKGSKEYTELEAQYARKPRKVSKARKSHKSNRLTTRQYVKQLQDMNTNSTNALFRAYDKIEELNSQVHDWAKAAKESRELAEKALALTNSSGIKFKEWKEATGNEIIKAVSPFLDKENIEKLKRLFYDTKVATQQNQN